MVASNDWSFYPHYHRSTDTPDHVNLIQGEQLLKMNVAAMAQLVGSKVGGVIFLSGFEAGDLNDWSNSSP